jgi:hypothetical protein
MPMADSASRLLNWLRCAATDGSILVWRSRPIVGGRHRRRCNSTRCEGQRHNPRGKGAMGGVVAGVSELSGTVG